MLDPEGNEVWRASGAPAEYPFEAWQAGEIVRDPLLFVATPSVSLVTGEYRFGVTLRAAEPLVPERADEPFAPLGSVKFHVKGNEEEEK
jgi:hypothetical protein